MGLAKRGVGLKKRGMGLKKWGVAIMALSFNPRHIFRVVRCQKYQFWVIITEKVITASKIPFLCDSVCWGDRSGNW